MGFRTYYAIQLLAVLVCVACCLATSSECDDCKYGFCVEGECKCSLNCDLYDNSRDYCLNHRKRRVSMCWAASKACGAKPRDVFRVREIKGTAKTCKDEVNGKKGEPIEFCHDQSYCSNGAGICIMKKRHNDSKICICDEKHEGSRCESKIPETGTSSKGEAIGGSTVVGVALLAAALASLALAVGILVARKCRRRRAPRRDGSRDTLEAGSLSSSASSTTVTDPGAGLSSNRSSQMLGESSPLWK